MASLRTRLQLGLVELWQHRGPLAWLLSPLSVLHYLGYQARRALYGLGLLRRSVFAVPVVVIGNLYVGGTGKTPLTIELARALAARGWRPGIVSRGYGGASSTARLVVATDRATDVGDEPLLMARATGLPVAVAGDRTAAARRLLEEHPDRDVLIADDGLQHWPLARDMEIALLHYRGLGNGWMLPAGPLREPRRRLDHVEAVVCHGDVPPVPAAAPRYAMHTALAPAYALRDPACRMPLDALVAEQQRSGWRIVAAAGIGMPDRYFAMLRAAGLNVEAMPLADHYDYSANPFADLAADRILITEKDAVKCAANPALADDARLWVVPLATAIDARLVDAVVERLAQHPRRTARGSPTA